MSGRAATTDKLPGNYALSVGRTDMPAPPGWSWVGLQDVARLESGHTPSRKYSEYWDGDVPWIGIKDARAHHGRRIFETLQTVSEEGLNNSAARLLPPETVCLSRTASVGYTLIMGRSMATSQDFVNWICSEALDPEFLMHLFIAEKESLLRFGRGTTHTTIYYPEVKAFHVCLPPSPEQQRIVAALESYVTRLDDAKASLERAHRNLERYRASVLKAAVEGRLVPTEAELARKEGRDYEPASVLLERILTERRRRWEEAELAKMEAKGRPPKNDKWKAKYKEPVEPDTSDLPELPEGWCWASTEQLEPGDRKCAYGVLVPGEHVDDGTPLVRVGDVRGGRIDTTNLKRIDQEIADRFAKTYLRGGEVLLTLVGTIGRTAVVPQTLADANVARAVGVLPLATCLEPRWVECWFRSPSVRQAMVGRAHEVARKTLNLEDVRSAPVALPSIAEQRRIVEEIAVLESAANRSEEQVEYSSSRCDRLRQSILKVGFEGKLVDQDPNDEPASELLARIKAEREAAAKSTPKRRRRASRKPQEKAS